jgi:hypothetical protein
MGLQLLFVEAAASCFGIKIPVPDGIISMSLRFQNKCNVHKGSSLIFFF